MSERNYALLTVILPGAVLAALLAYSAGAGCYALTMNCLSIVVPEVPVTRALFFAAAFSPFAAPAYLPVAVGGGVALRRGGMRALERWTWGAPALYAVLVHASALLFASWVLPERRLHPDLRFDAQLAAAGYVYLALARLAKPWLVRKRVSWGTEPRVVS